MARAIRVLVLCSESGDNRTATYYPPLALASLPDVSLRQWARVEFEREADALVRDIPTIPRPTFLRAEVSR